MFRSLTRTVPIPNPFAVRSATLLPWLGVLIALHGCAPEENAKSQEPLGAAAEEEGVQECPEGHEWVDGQCHPSQGPAEGAGDSVVSAPCRSDLSSGHAAVLGFWDAFEADRLADRGPVIDALTAALEAHPEEGEFALLLALAHLWRMAEWDRYTGDHDGGGMMASVGAVADAFVLAKTLCPEDYRIAAWLGPVWVRMGRMLGNDTLVDQGNAELDRGIAVYPEFVLFSRALVLGDLPPSDPNFQGAIDTLWENFAICAGTEFDRANPPVDTFLMQSEGADDGACRNSDRAEHNMEGTAIYFGDLFAKNGDEDLARAIYTQGTQTKGFADWPFRSVLEARIETLATRVAQYQDDDPANDPVWVGQEAHTCAVCHAR